MTRLAVNDPQRAGSARVCGRAVKPVLPRAAEDERLLKHAWGSWSTVLDRYSPFAR